MKKIDGHGHILPYPEQIPDFVRENNIFDVRWEKEESKRYMYNNGAKMRPITEAWSFPKERIDRMAQNEIAHTVVFPLSQLYLSTLDNKELVMKTLEWENGYNRELQLSHPDKFTTGIVIQPKFVSESIQQIEEAAKAGISLVFLCTHYHNNGERSAFGEDEKITNPILEAMNQYNMGLNFHPYEMEHIIKLKNTHRNHHTIFMNSLTAHTFQIFTGKGLHFAYPNIRTSFAHGNKEWFMGRGRIRQGQEGRPDLYKGCLPIDQVFEGVDNLFFDTLFHDEKQIGDRVQEYGAHRFFAGLDSPYPLGDFDYPYPPKDPTCPSYVPFRYLKLALDKGLITEPQAEQIYGKTIFDRVGGDMRKRVIH